MNQPCPPHWTFAARAAYFGELMCPYCDHRNPVGAKFCNDCAWPLHLKPCNRCNAVNDQAATHCYSCNAAFTTSPGTPEATPAVPSASIPPSRATREDEAFTAAVKQPTFTVATLRKGSRSLRPLPILFATVATVLVAGAYTMHERNVMTPDALDVAFEPVVAREPNLPDTSPAGPLIVQPSAVEAETPAALPVPNEMEIKVTADHGDASALRELGSRGDNDDPAMGMNVRPDPVTVPVTHRASARQRPASRQAPEVTRVTPVAHASTPVGMTVAERKKQRPDRWQAMQARLQSCGGDLITRIVCDQRVRLRFCEGYWGKAPQCASGVVNEHGQ